MRLTCALIAAAVLVTGFSGCGYSTASSLDEKYRTIHVTAFRNQSREYDLQAPLTNAVIRKFLNDGRLRVVGAASADLVVDGSILGYDLRGLTFDTNDDVSQFQIDIVARVRVTDSRTGEILWQEARLISDSSYSTFDASSASNRLRGNTQTFLPSVRAFQSDEENSAASEALERMAAAIFYRTVEPW